MEGKEVAVRQIMNIEKTAMSIDDLIGQVKLIQEVMSRIMVKDEHYGVIPGTTKPTLYKPGAEKLCLTFRLDPNYDIIREIREKEFIAYTVKCNLTHIPTGQSVASGIGSCNSKETKYRYRSENTERPVPPEYWQNRDSALLGGSQFKPRKKGNKWVIYEQIENNEPWDLDNTLIKMACKRALVAATLNATAASDIFTQDLEDMPPIVEGEVGEIKKDEETWPQECPACKKKSLYQDKKDENKFFCWEKKGGCGATFNALSLQAARDRALEEDVGDEVFGEPEKEEPKQTTNRSISAAQVKAFRSNLKSAKIEEDEICQRFDIEKVEDLPLAAQQEALAWIFEESSNRA